MIKNIRRHNTPVATLIKNYVDKKSGKVTVSRKEIQWRFWALDRKDQKTILAAFLEAGKEDRHWAYKQLLDYWDSSLGNKIKELWEMYHEQRCKWVVIRYLPLDYVRQNMQDFTEDRDYYFVCLRLAKDKDYVIEKEKLSLTDYFAVLYHTGREFDENSKSRDSDTTSWFFPVNLQDIRLAIYYLEKADCCKPVLAFEEWSDKVKKAMKDSQEYKRLHAHPFVDYDYERRKLDILRKYAYMALDDKYKMPSDPSADDFLKPVKEYSEGGRTVFDTFSTSSQSDSIMGSQPIDPEEILPF